METKLNSTTKRTAARFPYCLIRLVRDTPWGVILALIFGGFLQIGAGLVRGFDYGSMLAGGVILLYALIALITLRPILSSNPPVLTPKQSI